MPPAKRSSSTTSKASAAPKRTSARSASASTAAKSGAKATATSARKAAGRSSTQAKSGTTKTGNAAKAGAKDVKTTAKGAATRTRRAGGGSDGVASVAEQLAKGVTKPRDLVILTRDRIQETLDEAASRGRMTRKDADELVAEIVKRGRAQSDELVGQIEALLERGRGQLESATKRARKADPVDRIVRGADRARRAAGVGPSFPILGYDDLNAAHVQTRIKQLTRPEKRKVLTYERKHANRKGVIGAIEKSLA
jgi:polyhydroxyalkanoate synthesis regulator phasin